MKLTLRPNVNSKTTSLAGRPFHEMIEVANEGELCPWGIVHIDVFYDRDDHDLHDRLASGETVTVEVTPATDWHAPAREINTNGEGNE